MTVLQDHTEITKENGEYIYTSIYQKKMTVEEIDKFYKHLVDNVVSVKKLLEELDIKKQTETKEAALQNELLIKKDALKNFDLHFSENLEEMRRNKLKNKLQAKKWIEIFPEYKQVQLNKHMASIHEQRKLALMQIHDHDKQIKVYEKYKSESVDKADETTEPDQKPKE